MRPKTKKFLDLMIAKKRLLNTDEAFDFYIENIMRTDVTCKLNNYRPGRHFDDYKLWELEAKASQWHRNTLGSLVLAGYIQVNYDQDNQRQTACINREASVSI